MYSNSHLCLRIYKFIQPGLFIFNPNLGFKINSSNTCTGYGVYCIVLSTKFLSLKAPLCASATPTLSVRGRPFFYLFLFYSLGGALTMWHALQLFFFFFFEKSMLYNFVLRIEEGIFITRIVNWILSHVWTKKKMNKRNVTGMSLRSLFNKNLV